ncbi:MAG TPA: efflux RND transporter periplasmic adaptor subunit, partial [Chitinophagaceae bacterium]
DKQVTNNMSIRTDNANSLFVISDLKNVWIWANVYESSINSVHLGDEVAINTLAYPDKQFTGKIDKIMNVLDPTNKVMKIRVILPNPDYSLKPEMFASVTVANKTQQQSLCIPSTSLVFDNSQYYVLLYKSQKDVRITPVQVTSKYGDKTFITGDIQQGDKIVGSNTVLIYQALNG